MALILVTTGQTFTADAVLELIQQLHPLREWEPVGALLEVARLALSGHEGLKGEEILKLKVWSKRWRSLPKKLQKFYLTHIEEHQEAHSALCRVLMGGQPVHGAQYGKLKELWLTWDCAQCPYDIAPVERR